MGLGTESGDGLVGEERLGVVAQEGVKFAAVLAVKGLCVLLALICAISALALGLNS